MSVWDYGQNLPTTQGVAGTAHVQDSQYLNPKQPIPLQQLQPPLHFESDASQSLFSQPSISPATFEVGMFVGGLLPLNTPPATHETIPVQAILTRPLAAGAAGGGGLDGCSQYSQHLFHTPFPSQIASGYPSAFHEAEKTRAEIEQVLVGTPSSKQFLQAVTQTPLNSTGPSPSTFKTTVKPTGNAFTPSEYSGVKCVGATTSRGKKLPTPCKTLGEDPDDCLPPSQPK